MPWFPSEPAAGAQEDNVCNLHAKQEKVHSKLTLNEVKSEVDRFGLLPVAVRDAKTFEIEALKWLNGELSEYLVEQKKKIEMEEAAIEKPTVPVSDESGGEEGDPIKKRKAPGDKERDSPEESNKRAC